MTNLPRFLFKNFLVLLCFLAVPLSFASAAPRVTFDPTTVTVNQNNTFQVSVGIDPESNQVIGSDVTVSYAGADLEVTAVSSGNYFPEFHYANNPSGTIEIHSYVTSVYQQKTGAGTLGTITFKAKKGSGSSTITFVCSGNNTTILSSTGSNVISCSQVNQVGVSYTGGSNPTNTLTPTATLPAGATATLTRTPTATQAPSGNTAPTCSSLTPNITQGTGTPLAITYACGGTDAGGKLMAAEFSYGDGTSQVVEKDVGSPGAVSVTHTYTSVGTFAVTCRVRDNDGVWSSIPSACTQTVKVLPRPTSVRTPTAAPTTDPYDDAVYQTLTPTPTRAIVQIIEETPYPTFAPVETTPEPIYEAESDTGSSRAWWIGGGILALLLAFLLLRRKKPPTPPITGTPQATGEQPSIIIEERPPTFNG